MIIAIAHQKGGCSKTTIAFNLAIELKASRVYDLDVGKGGTTGLKLLAELRKRTGHGDINAVAIEDEDQLIDVIESDEEDKITIIDLGGLDSKINRVALIYADMIITPANESSLEIGGLNEFAHILETISEKAQKNLTSFVVAARMNSQRKSFPAIEQICEKRDCLVFTNCSLPLYVDYIESFNQGLSVCEYAPKGNAAKQMKQLVKYIKNNIKKILK